MELAIVILQLVTAVVGLMGSVLMLRAGVREKRAVKKKKRR